MMDTQRSVLFTTGLALLLASSLAEANIIDFSFGGTITSVDAPLTAQFAVGDPAQFVVSFDSNAPQDPTLVGLYPMQSFSFSSGSYASHTSGAQIENIFLINDDPTFQFDNWLAQLAPANAPSIAGQLPGIFDIALTDFSHSALSSLALPASLNLADFGQRDFQLDYCQSVGVFPGGVSCNVVSEVQGRIDSLAITSRPPAAVPEPAPLSLVAIGLMAWGASMRRRQPHHAAAR